MSMLLATVGLLVVAWLPGAVAFHLPCADRDRRAALDAEERLFWAVVTSAALSSGLVVALAALGGYTFTRLVAIDLAVAAALALLSRGRLALGSGRRRPTATALFPLALIALACWLYFPPFEYVFGGKDPGVYINEGIQLAKRGTLVVEDPIVATLPSRARDLFFPRYEGAPGYYSLRFMGFLVLDPDRGTILAQFPHLCPAWIAIGYGVAGLRGALATTPVAAILGLLALYFAGARLVGRGAAFLGAALLAVNVAMVWFAREPNSEVVALVLLFAALLALARSQVDGDRFFAPIAALLYGVLLFVRFDMALALAGVVVAAVLQGLEGRRPRWLFVVPLGALLAVAWWYHTGIMAPYAAFARTFFANLRPVHLVLIALGGVALAAVIPLSRNKRVASALRAIVPWIVIVTLLVAACYAYFFRMPVHGVLAFGDARSLEIFTWYFPPLALVLALAGFARVASKQFWRAPALIVTVVFFSFLLFYKLRVVHEHFWAARRFITVILPASSLMAGAALWWPVSLTRPFSRRLAGIAATVLFLVVGTSLLRASWPVIWHVEYAGAVGRVANLARYFTADDLVIVESRNTSSDLHALALPLAYIWDRNVLVLASVKPDKHQFRDFLTAVAPRYRHIYFVGGGGTDLVSPSIGIEPVASDRFQLPEYESASNAYPRKVHWKEFDYGVYRLTQASVSRNTFELDVGRFDDLNVVRFHAKERLDGQPFRWSQRSSYIALPPIDHARTLTLWASDGGRPGTVEPAQVSVYLNDRLLGTARVGSGFAAYPFAIPEGAMNVSADPDQSVLVRLVTNTWKPRQALGTSDDRDLGIMVRRVEVK